jgi:hypothetical protein
LEGGPGLALSAAHRMRMSWASIGILWERDHALLEYPCQ